MYTMVKAWWILARPAGLWIPPLLPLLGFSWAHWDRAMLAWGLQDLPWVLAAWVLLQSGTLWINAHRDQDQGEVLLGQAVSVPAHTNTVGFLALGGAVLLAAGAGWLSAAITLICAVLAVLYSHPKTAWKGHPILGPLVNVLGYGILSPAAGYYIVGTPLTPRTLATAALLAVSVLGWTFIAQAFQEDEDKARGDRTLVATHGPRVALWTGRACLGAVSIGFTVLVALGWYPWPTIIALPALLWMDRQLAHWLRRGGDESSARKLVISGLLSLTLMVTGAAAAYVNDSLADRPVAGMGTYSGHPTDRSPRPASQQKALDWHHRSTTGSAYRPN
ncbi:MAG: prenyltransferase [Myxococcota bacterium]